MDFLEIRRKAKERAAARAEAASRAAPGVPAQGAAGAIGTAAPEPPFPLALEPMALPSAPGGPPPTPLGPSAPAAPAPLPPRAGIGADPDAVAEEAARIEAALAERLESLPAAGDGRFKTWRPLGEDVPGVAPIAPDDAGPGRHGGRDDAAQGGLTGDPLDEFFYRDDEAGPAMGGLASPVLAMAAPEQVERDEYLTFRLGEEEYGVAIGRVREVMRAPPLTEVPRAPAGVLGVITVRGDVVAVFDPRQRLGLPPGPAGEAGRVVIVDDGSGLCGLQVDEVASVVRLPRGSLEACPQGMGGHGADCLEGIGRERDRLFTVLDLAALLRPRRGSEGRG